VARVSMRYLFGGGGGGGAAAPSSGNALKGPHPAAPGRQTCAVCATWPLATIARSASSVYGPYVLPSMTTDQRAPVAATGGGGTAPAPIACPIAEPIATPAPRPAPAPASPPGLAAAIGIAS